MEYCTSCGRELPSDAKFCPECGSPTGQVFAKRKTIYEGEVRKCPQCGGVINAFVSVCPSCGHEMRGASATSVVHDLAMQLEKTHSTSEKERLIRNFYIPNTREDIIECLILASSNIETNSDCSDAWAAKLEQIYQKAKLTFGNSTEFEYVETMYNKAVKNFRKQKNILTAKRASGGILYGAGTAISGIWRVLSLVLGGIWKLIDRIIGLIKSSEIFQILVFFVIFLIVANVFISLI